MIYIGTEGGIYRWIKESAWPVFHSLQEQSVISLAVAGEGAMAVLDAEGSLWETTNNGMDWRKLARPVGLARPTLVLDERVKPASWLMALAGPLSIQRRRIGAVLPEEEPEPLGLATLKRFVPGMKRESAAATLTRPKRSRAERWTELGVPGTSLTGQLNGIRVFANSAETGVWFAAITGDGLWRSGDAGSSWVRCEGAPLDVLSLRSAGQLVVAGTSEGVWVSEDSGVSWSERSEGLERARNVTAVAIRPGNSKMLLAGAGERDASGAVSHNALYDSKDGGLTWKRVSRGFPYDQEADIIADIRHDLVAPEFAVVAMSSGELWKTFTDGFWWEPLARQIHRARVLCATS